MKIESVRDAVQRWQEENRNFHRDTIVGIVEDFEEWRRGEAAVYLRDLDGTGSMHPCAKGDPGAVRYVRDDE